MGSRPKVNGTSRTIAVEKVKPGMTAKIIPANVPTIIIRIVCKSARAINPSKNMSMDYPPYSYFPVARTLYALAQALWILRLVLARISSGVSLSIRGRTSAVTTGRLSGPISFRSSRMRK